MDGAAVKRVLLTVGVEDYFQVGSFEGLIQRENWYRFETRIARNTEKALDLFDDFGIQATFFVLGCVADAMPEVVREIARRQTLRGEEKAARAWIARLASPLARANALLGVAEPASPPDAEPHRILEAERTLDRLSAAIAALPLVQREAFLMHHEGELSIAEIAAATGVNEEAAKSRLRYAMNKLRGAIGDE